MITYYSKELDRMVTIPENEENTQIRKVEHLLSEEKVITKLINRVSKTGSIKVVDWVAKEERMILDIEIDADAVDEYHSCFSEYDVTDQF